MTETYKCREAGDENLEQKKKITGEKTRLGSHGQLLTRTRLDGK